MRKEMAMFSVCLALTGCSSSSGPVDAGGETNVDAGGVSANPDSGGEVDGGNSYVDAGPAPDCEAGQNLVSCSLPANQSGGETCISADGGWWGNPNCATHCSANELPVEALGNQSPPSPSWRCRFFTAVIGGG